MIDIDGILELKIGKTKRRYPFTISRIFKDRICFRMHGFKSSDRWAFKHILEFASPDDIFIGVHGRYSKRDDTVYFNLSLHSHKGEIAQLLKGDKISLPCTFYIWSWEKSFKTNIKFTFYFNDQGLMKLFNKIL